MQDPIRVWPDSDVERPVLLSEPPLEYPEDLRRSRLQGIVMFELIVTEEGDVWDVRVLRPLHPALDDLAARHVRKRQLKPAQKCGRPVTAYVTSAVTFRLG